MKSDEYAVITATVFIVGVFSSLADLPKVNLELDYLIMPFASVLFYGIFGLVISYSAGCKFAEAVKYILEKPEAVGTDFLVQLSVEWFSITAATTFGFALNRLKKNSDEALLAGSLYAVMLFVRSYYLQY